ncbi:thioredoxin domain protein [Bernardetia litoralis DSM 6794]|uniref:Thioredoxin domain protein n=1 Tax=Bernardetia litoralis (strain ATCC 23117 / DSM 6794 / NBRC 15988 / NCIMB 1366 / Fx l1 / Sio-4) TaxID=880071 RepID=I4AQQ8_BERLS|nr:thioredoxin domain-containing protein [Bernardetia litoralis]AFM06293.1 thioredoxin domain protein [Bernardetia litoralis DSM 6794]
MNQLSKSRSPYLLQHAQNPVHWQMWNNETLQKAKQENKPILVSIGYSACHWCHVMEHESFENEDVAKAMNENFICIKVDREERPDVDAIYMEAVQMMGVSGGWPLNVFLTSDAKPFWGGTYFPAKEWIDIVEQIGKTYKNKRNEVEESANKVTKVLSISTLERYNLKDVSDFDDSILAKAFQSLEKKFDTEFGGIGEAPKFPMPSYYLFLLRYYDYLDKNNQDQNITNPTKNKILSQIHLTLNKMDQGGIYDQIGGGFARYSVDKEWFAPHFEKMLYDNAQLLSLYAEAYTITEDKVQKHVYKEIIEQTTEFLTRELQDKNGGFYAALDADSEGKEGKFYTWTIDEIEQVFTNHTFSTSINQEEDLQLFKKYYSITAIGNWQSPHATEGANILYRNNTDEEFAQENNIELNNLKCKVKEWQNYLLEIRKTKVSPSLDDKILTSWNALLIKGFCNSYSSLNDKKYLNLALQTAEFIEKNLFDKQNTKNNKLKLHHTFKDGTAEIDGFLEDYALLIESYIALYQVCFDEKWLLRADELTKYVFTNFYDKEEKLFYFTNQNESEKLVAQKKELFDNVISSSNSVMATNLYFLGILLENNLYKETSKEMLSKVASLIAAEPRHVSNWASLFTYFLTPTPEIAIVGEKYQEVLQEISSFYIPNKVIVATKSEEEGQKSSLPLLEMRPVMNNQTTIYVCKNKMCQLPVNSVEEALKQI